MRLPKYHLIRNRPSHFRSNKRRNVKAIAAAVAIIGLGAYLLYSFHTRSSHTGSTADSGPLNVPPAVLTCTDPVVIPMAPDYAQSGITENDYYVTNDTWNADHYTGLSQTLHVCNYNSWYTLATMNNATGDGAVKTSPNVQETWYPTQTKLSRWKSITSQFSDLPPGVGSNYGIWEFEYDIWLNGLADSNSTEVMIWTYNNGQSPRGSQSGSFTDGGQTYDVYRSSPPYQYIAFVDRRNNLSGQVNLLDFFKYVISRGWMPSSSTLDQICHGVELVSTNSKPEKFTVSNFSINMKVST